MRNKYIRIVTVFSLLAICIIQSLWLYNSYLLIKNNIYAEINKVLDRAVEEEAINRLKSTPKGTRIDCVNSTDEISQILALEEGLYRLGYPISMEYIDSIVSKYLKENRINNEYVVRTASSENGDKLFGASLSKWSDIGSQVVPIRADRSQGLQLVVRNPYELIFERMILLLITTLVVLSFAFYGLYHQSSLIISERKVAEEREAIAQYKEDFSYAMVHDLKTPLNTILECTNRLYKETNDKTDFMEKYFRRLKENTQQLLLIIGQHLDLFKLENNRLEINKTRVPLAPILHLLKEKYVTNPAKQVSFITEMKVGSVVADTEHLQRMLGNLIDNSIKYSIKSVEIKITSTCDEQYDIIKVRDNGIGISAKDQTLIFEKFERASAVGRTLNGGPTGFGLGLNYVSRIMNAHGGKITVESRESEFSEFSLYFPKVEEV